MEDDPVRKGGPIAVYSYAFRRELTALATFVVLLLVHAPFWLAVVLAVCAWAVTNEVSRRVRPKPVSTAELIRRFEAVAARLPQREPSPYRALLAAARDLDALPDTAINPIEREALLRECLTAAIQLGTKIVETRLHSGAIESAPEAEYRQLIGDLARKMTLIRTNAVHQQDNEMRAEVSAFRELLTPPAAEENVNLHG